MADGDAPAQALATAVTTPLLAGVRAGLRPERPPSGSFCTAEGEAEVLALRPARGGHALSVLLHSSAPAPREVTLRFPAPERPPGLGW